MQFSQETRSIKAESALLEACYVGEISNKKKHVKLFFCYDIFFCVCGNKTIISDCYSYLGRI